MNYWELREIVAQIIPRKSQFFPTEIGKSLIQEKGRKRNYYQFDLLQQDWIKSERLLDLKKIKGFAAVSLRAPHCPMPFNIDTWDGMRCVFGCRYCFADTFKSTLYSSFYDNWREMGYRYCDPDFFKNQLDRYMKHRGNPARARGEITKSFALGIPIRFGIRFEDFAYPEAEKGISLELLRYLAEVDYPVMINTKSDLIGTDPYIKTLVDNKGGSAVHITAISADKELVKKIEPNAPNFEQRMKAAKNLSNAGIRVVGRIEPLMVFVNDKKEEVYRLIEAYKDAGISHITFDTYSFSAGRIGPKRNMESIGIDFERMFEITSESQWLGSLLLSKFIDIFRQEGFKCSTFDLGNVPANNDWICCEVGDIFKGFNYGNTITAIKYIQNENRVVTWKDFSDFVESKGGFISDRLKLEVWKTWNLMGDTAYSPDWAAGIVPCGRDQDGNIRWKYVEEDFREELLKYLI